MSFSNSEESLLTLYPVQVTKPSSESTTSPAEDWSSLELQYSVENIKRNLYQIGAYDPGSGEICSIYIPRSDSTVLRHPYYQYPSVQDPGIVDALVEADRVKIYPPDGQQLYLDLCKEMKIAPANIFYHALITDAIDMRYYGVCAKGVRAISLALMDNESVTRLDLSSNFLSVDACHHLGQLVGRSHSLREILLSQCNIPPKGMKQLVTHLKNRNLDLLDVSLNNLGDEGFQYITEQLEKGGTIKRLNASHNILTYKTANAFAEVLHEYNCFTHIDLSWNQLGIQQNAASRLLNSLSTVSTLSDLNLSYNSFTCSDALTDLLSSSIKYLNLSNNQLKTNAVPYIANGIKYARRLKTLNLSENPLTCEDAMSLLLAFSTRQTKVLRLYLDHVDVERPFVDLMEQTKVRRPTVTITHGRIVRDFEIDTPDLKEIVLKRLDYLSKLKKAKLHFSVYFLTIEDRGAKYQDVKSMSDSLKQFGIAADVGLLTELSNCFPGPIINKNERSIHIAATCETIRRMYPDNKPLESHENFEDIINASK